MLKNTSISPFLEALAIMEGPQNKEFLEIIIANTDCCVPGSVLSTSHVLIHVVLTKTIWYYNCPYEEMGVQRI